MRPDGSNWYKFDDERVTKEDAKAAIEGQFGEYAAAHTLVTRLLLISAGIETCGLFQNATGKQKKQKTLC